MTKNQLSFYIFSISLFLLIYYLLYGFQFGENNNQEELPLLYEMTSKNELYPLDQFVSFHTSHYTQITPLLNLMAIPIWWLNIENIKAYFLVLHLISLIFYYVVLHLFLKRLVNFNALQSSISILIISLISSKFIPSGRWLFINFMDPEIITIIIIFYFFYYHVAKKYIPATLSITLAGVLYPIYIIPIYPTIIFLMYFQEYQDDKVKSLKILIGYALIPAIYTVFLWEISRQTLFANFDASYIMEYIRAPWHYKIPSITYMNKKSVGFFLLTIPFLILGRKLIKSDYWSRSLYLLIVGIFCTLVLCSIVHSIIRIPLLVQISPYRIGLFSVLLTFLLIIQLLVPWINRLKLSLPFKINFSWHVIGTLITLTGLSLILRDEFHQEQFSPSKMELINWIKGQTNSHDLFLDYANVDVRTNCKRSSYFEFKTISLTANTQIDWYQRFLKYNNFTGMIHPRDLSEKIKEDSGPVIQTFGVAGKNKFDVLTNIRDHITYVITYADDSLTLDKGKPVFQNENYLVFKSKE